MFDLEPGFTFEEREEIQEIWQCYQESLQKPDTSLWVRGIEAVI